MDRIAADRSLSEAALRVAMVMRPMFNTHTGDAWPSQATLAERTRLTDRAVRDGLKALVQRGHLEARKRFGRNGTRRYAIPSTGTMVPVDETFDRNSGSASTGTTVPHRPEPSFRQTPEEPLSEPVREAHARATSSKSQVDEWDVSEDMLILQAKHALGVTQERAARVVSKFFNHHRSEGTRKADWVAAFWKWLSDEADMIEGGKSRA